MWTMILMLFEEKSQIWLKLKGRIMINKNYNQD